MKQFFIKILSTIMALTVLFTTSSFNVDLHYCCNTLVDISIFGKADTCINTTKITPGECTIEDQSCCDNETFVRLGDEDLKKDSFKYDLESLIFLHSFLYTYVELLKDYSKQSISFQNHRAPLRSKDILILHQAFLI